MNSKAKKLMASGGTGEAHLPVSSRDAEARGHTAPTTATQRNLAYL